MPILRFFARYGYVPFMLLGINGFALALTAYGTPLWIVSSLALLAAGVAFLMERLLPYEQAWNEAQDDAIKDMTHGVVYQLSNLQAILLLPLIVSMLPWAGFWPSQWPIWIQLPGAIVAADVGMTVIHYASHRIGWLWRMHSVHHGVPRLYSFNGM